MLFLFSNLVLGKTLSANCVRRHSPFRQRAQRERSFRLSETRGKIFTVLSDSDFTPLSEYNERRKGAWFLISEQRFKNGGFWKRINIMSTFFYKTLNNFSVAIDFYYLLVWFSEKPSPRTSFADALPFDKGRKGSRTSLFCLFSRCETHGEISILFSKQRLYTL